MNLNLSKRQVFYLLLVLILFPVITAAQEEKALISALSEAEKNQDAAAMAEACYKLGVYYDDQDSVRLSTIYLRDGLRWSRKSGSIKQQASVLNYLASVLSYAGTADSINQMYKQSADLFLQTGDTAKAADVMLNLGMELVNAGSYQKALEVKLKALEYRIICGDSTNISFYFQQVGEVYKELKLNDKWKYYLEKARILAGNEKYARHRTRISILNDLGGIYADEQNYQAALKAYQEMINFSLMHNYPRGVATANANLVEVYFALDDPHHALESALKSYNMSKEGNAYRQISATENLAGAYKKLGDFNKAIVYYRQALNHPNILDYTDEYLVVLKGIAFVSAKIGNYADAFTYQSNYLRLHDSVNSLEVKKNISLLETSFRTREQSQQIALLSAQNQLQQEQIKRIRSLLLLGGIALFLFLFVIYLLFRQHRLRHFHSQLLLEQKLLRTQMNPHFIFNALAAVQQFLLKGDAAQASDYLGHFALLMRSVLKSSREEWISLKEEIGILESYLKIQKLRFETHLTYELIVDPALETEFIFIPPLMIQPFIENAVEHGINQMEKPGFILLQITESADNVIFKIEDNGPGLSSESAKKDNHLSYATTIFNERVKNLNKRLPRPISFSMNNIQTTDTNLSGLRVEICIPISSKIPI